MSHDPNRVAAWSLAAQPALAGPASEGDVQLAGGPLPGPVSDIRRALDLIAAERPRAARAAAVAARHEALALRGPLRDVHLQMAAIHLQAARRHRMTVRLYEAAVRLHPAGPGAGPDLDTALMRATAHLARSDGAVLAMFDSQLAETLLLASCAAARRAHDLEIQVGEGPSFDAVRTGQPVIARSAGAGRRWQFYESELAAFGVNAVAAIPLRVGSACLGALTLFNPAPVPIGTVTELGEALAYSLLEHALDHPGTSGRCRARVHEAAGILSVRRGCSVADAMVLIRARAFAEGATVDAVAHDIVTGREADA
jgi:hypothetical protein